MPTVFRNLILQIESYVRSVKTEAKQKDSVNKKIISDMFNNKVPRVLQQSFFKSPYTVNNKYITAILIEDKLYIKPHGLNIGAMYDISMTSEIVEKSLKHIFILANPSLKFGERSFTNDMAIKAIGNLIDKHMINVKRELFQIDK